MNFFSQYSLNMVTIVSSTILALVRSVAVASMNTFFVFRVILERSPEIQNRFEISELRFQKVIYTLRFKKNSYL